MSQCSLCSRALSFSTTPLFGSGKLSDGSVLCTKCYAKAVVIIDTNTKLSSYSTNQISSILSPLMELEQKIQAYGYKADDKILAMSEIAELSKIITHDESLVAIVHGFMDSGIGVLVATSKRIMFIDKRLTTVNTNIFMKDKISSIKRDGGIMLSDIIITAGSQIIKVKNVSNTEAEKFCNHANMMLSAPDKSNNTAPIDIADQLEKFAALKDKGIITEEEFNQQKAKLLAL